MYFSEIGKFQNPLIHTEGSPRMQRIMENPAFKMLSPKIKEDREIARVRQELVEESNGRLRVILVG